MAEKIEADRSNSRSRIEAEKKSAEVELSDIKKMKAVEKRTKRECQRRLKIQGQIIKAT